MSAKRERRIELLRENLEEVEARIQAACDRAGRKREEVTLISVSKTKPVETLKEAYDLGVRVFGENKCACSAKIKYRRSGRNTRHCQRILSGI